MVLIDSPTDLLAMESSPSSNTGYYFGNYDYEDPWNPDMYLQGAFEKRVADLELFAKNKNLDYLAYEENHANQVGFLFLSIVLRGVLKGKLERFKRLLYITFLMNQWLPKLENALNSKVHG